MESSSEMSQNSEDPSLPLNDESVLPYHAVETNEGEPLKLNVSLDEHMEHHTLGQVDGSVSVGAISAPHMTMKDYDAKLKQLEKDNMNLKLRIHIMEQRAGFHNKNMDDGLKTFKINIESEVENEKLRKDLAEREQLLEETYKAMKTLEERHSLEIRNLKFSHEDSLRQLQEQHEEDLKLLKQQTDEADRQGGISDKSQLLYAEAFGSMNLGRPRMDDGDGGGIAYSEAVAQNEKLQDVLTEKNAEIYELNICIKEKDSELEQMNAKLELQKDTIEDLQAKPSEDVIEILRAAVTGDEVLVEENSFEGLNDVELARKVVETLGQTQQKIAALNEATGNRNEVIGLLKGRVEQLRIGIEEADNETAVKMEFQKKIEEIEEIKKGLQDENEKLRESEERLKARVEDQLKQIDALKKEVERAEKEVERGLNQEREDALKKNEESLKAQIREHVEAISVLSAQVKTLKAENLEARQEADKMTEELEKTEREIALERKINEKYNNQQLKDLRELTKQLKVAEGQKEAVENDYKALKETLTNATVAIEEFVRREVDKDALVAKLERKVTKKTENFERLTTEYEKLKARYRSKWRQEQTGSTLSHMTVATLSHVDEKATKNANNSARKAFDLAERIFDEQLQKSLTETHADNKVLEMLRHRVEELTDFLETLINNKGNDSLLDISCLSDGMREALHHSLNESRRLSMSLSILEDPNETQAPELVEVFTKNFKEEIDRAKRRLVDEEETEEEELKKVREEWRKAKEDAKVAKVEVEVLKEKIQELEANRPTPVSSKRRSRSLQKTTSAAQRSNRRFNRHAACFKDSDGWSEPDKDEARKRIGISASRIPVRRDGYAFTDDTDTEEKMRNEIARLNSRIRSVEDQKSVETEEMKRRVTEATALYEALRAEKMRIQGELNKLKGESLKEIEMLRSTIEDQITLIATLNADLKLRTEEKSKWMEERAAMREEQSGMVARMEEAERRLNEVQKEFKEKEAGWVQKVKEVSAKIQNKEEERREMAARVGCLEEERRELIAKIEVIEDERRAMGAKIGSVEEEKRELAEKVEQTEAERLGLEESVQKYEAEVGALYQKLEETQTELVRVEAELTDAKRNVQNNVQNKFMSDANEDQSKENEASRYEEYEIALGRRSTHATPPRQATPPRHVTPSRQPLRAVNAQLGESCCGHMETIKDLQTKLARSQNSLRDTVLKLRKDRKQREKLSQEASKQISKNKSVLKAAAPIT